MVGQAGSLLQDTNLHKIRSVKFLLSAKMELMKARESIQAVDGN